MKKFFKLTAVVMALLITMLCVVGCDEKKDSSDGSKQDTAATDSEYVKEKGKLIIGITEFEPMDYKEEGSDEWVGFDADMAKEFAKSLGVDAEFVIIEWDNKALELSGKTIDCVWNGMTLTDEVTSSMDCSDAYCNNAQVVVLDKSVADKYKTAEDCKDLSFAVEKGSAGAKEAEANGYTFTEVLDQATAVFEVSGKTSDAAIIDSLMAGAMVGEGTGYSDLTTTVKLSSELYGVGFRKGSDLTEKLNKFFDECRDNGKMLEIAEKYGVQDAVILK